jgi:Zn-dependent peptidase ImmA (M78 family)
MAYVQLPNPVMSMIAPFQRTAPVNVVAIAQALGLSVWEEVLDKNISGKLFRDPVNGGSSGFSIVVNAPDALNRKRFTVAHEIAHFILHRNQIGEGLSDDTFYRSGLSTAQEVEANKMAADIIMPYQLIDSLQRNGTVSVSDLARALQVSEVAMMIRLGIPIP